MYRIRSAAELTIGLLTLTRAVTRYGRMHIRYYKRSIVFLRDDSPPSLNRMYILCTDSPSAYAHTIYTYIYKVTNRWGKEGENDYYTFKFPTVCAALKRIVPPIARYILFYLFFSPLMPTNSLFRCGIMKRSRHGWFASMALQCYTRTCKRNNV